MTLSVGSVPRTALVHRMVLETFIGPCPDGMEGCHWDGDPAHNWVGNLRWDTRSNNHRDAVAHGTHHQTSKLACPLEHLLAVPNLTVHAAGLGHRNCLACARGRATVRNAWFRKGLVLDVRAEADVHYSRIMAA